MNIKTILLVIVSIFVVLVVFAFDKIYVPNTVTEPIVVQETVNQGAEYIIAENRPVFQYKKGKVIYKVQATDVDFNNIEYQTVDVSVFYDVYNTDIDTDISLFTITGVVYVADGEFSPILWLKTVDIPLDTFTLIDSVSNGYGYIRDCFINEFNEGFPAEPTEDSILGYIRWFFDSISQSLKSVVITLDFVLYPINIYGGILL